MKVNRQVNGGYEPCNHSLRCYKNAEDKFMVIAEGSSNTRYTNTNIWERQYCIFELHNEVIVSKK